MAIEKVSEHSVSDQWSLLLHRVLARAPQNRFLPASRFRTSTGADVAVEYFGHSPKKILVTVPDDGETVAIHLDALGEVESVRSSIVRERRFDNGETRGPKERGFLSRLEFRQDFRPDGSVSDHCFDYDHSVAQLRVHSKSSVGGVDSTTANTYLEYGFSETGVFPSVEKETQSAMEFPRKIRHFFGRGTSVFENRLEAGGEDARKNPDVTTIAEAGASYFVAFGDGRVEISLGGVALGAFPVRRSLDIDRLIDLLVRDRLEPAEENVLVIGTVAAQVDGVLDR